MENIKTMGFKEMDERELRSTEGGVWWEIAIAAWVLYEVGYAVGKAIAHATSK
jgi:lactobin A/cerein 7B family class IIb bacteriocin